MKFIVKYGSLHHYIPFRIRNRHNRNWTFFTSLSLFGTYSSPCEKYWDLVLIWRLMLLAMEIISDSEC
jgi:hypothetical protein